MAKPYRVHGVANSLWSETLAPIAPEARTGSLAAFTALWAALPVCLPMYLLVSGMVAEGMGAGPVLLTMLGGSVLMALLAGGFSHAGVKYGIPFAVLARAGFGVEGARLVVALRTLVACGWLGIVCWLGGEGLLSGLRIAMPTMPGGVVWVGFGVFLLLAVIAPGRGWKMQAGVWVGAGLLLVVMLGQGLIAETGGSGAVPLSVARLSLTHFVLLGMAALLGLWLPVLMGAADVTRRVASLRAHLWGAFVLPVAIILFSSVVMAVASRGSASWNPVTFLGTATRPLIAIACLSGLTAGLLLMARPLCGWLGEEISGLMPAKITATTGRWFAASLAFLWLPWRLLADPQRYISGWLVGCAGVLAPVAAIVLVEYFALRRQWLNVEDLYQRDGLYEYAGGWNWKAFASLGAGWLVILLVQITPRLREFADRSVWVGIILAAGMYWVLRSGPPEAAAIPPTPLLIPLAGFEGEGASS